MHLCRLLATSSLTRAHWLFLFWLCFIFSALGYLASIVVLYSSWCYGFHWNSLTVNSYSLIWDRICREGLLWSTFQWFTLIFSISSLSSLQKCWAEKWNHENYLMDNLLLLLLLFLPKILLELNMLWQLEV